MSIKKTVLATQIERFNAFITARVASLSGLKPLSFPLTARFYDIASHLPHPKLSHNEKWSFGDLGLAIAT
ncbi:hypothetical protein MEO93_16520, partial [Dolichospermum sp. ST_sed3]|nr:hypothetical protein [Dolichospermum sp. ST_sed3]